MVRVRLEFGPRGARVGAGRGDVVVVVDVLSSTTTVALAASRGAIVYPCRDAEEAGRLAEQRGIERSLPRAKAKAIGGYSLSPFSFANAEPATQVALASPNGATCVREAAEGAAAVLTGALVNARAAAEAAAHLAGEAGVGITVVACGERVREPDGDGPLRFALEDYLGAGAVLSCLDMPRSPEADVCAEAWLAVRDRAAGLLRECPSGIELLDMGFGEDVDYAAQVDLLAVAPRLVEGALRP